MIQPRDRSGRYDHGTKCDACGKPVGDDYCTDTEVCSNTDGPGFYLCSRAECVKRREAREAIAGIEGLRALYTEQRAKNDNRKRSRATNRKGATMATAQTTKPNAPGMDAQAIADLETSARARRLAEAVDSLKMYAENRIQPGGFLIAVLENNLMGAIGRADDVSILTLGDIAQHVYQKLPRRCWGSPEIVNAWLRRS